MISPLPLIMYLKADKRRGESHNGAMEDGLTGNLEICKGVFIGIGTAIRGLAFSGWVLRESLES